jgi:dimethylhistidine N-methyltransferase
VTAPPLLAGPATVLLVDRHLTAADRHAALADDVRRGLTGRRKQLPPKWLYDTEGSRLFEEITRLPEYYPTRVERTILAARVDEIATLTGADTLVELGSGTSEKTRLLLDALARTGQLARFVPFDVDESGLTAAGAAVAAEYPGIAVHGVVGDFERHLGLLPRGGRQLVAFLGGTIGNLLPADRHALLTTLRAGLEGDGALLLGTDLVKDRGRLLAAYDDAEGVTAAFNRNVLRVVDRELDADLDPAAFDHVAVWDAGAEWIEMRLRARTGVTARVGALGLTVRFAAGEELRTEISAKFRPERVAAELAAARLRLVRWWTDPAGDFALSLSRPG